MKHVSLNQGSLGGLLERYESLLKNVKVVIPSTLFDVEPSWEKLKENKCPICGNKLKVLQKAPLSMCMGRRHGDRKPFIIKVETLSKFLSPVK